MAALQQRLAGVVEDEQREGVVQRSFAVVAGGLGERTKRLVLGVDEDQLFVVAWRLPRGGWRRSWWGSLTSERYASATVVREVFDATSISVTVTLRSRSVADVEDQAWLLDLPEDATENERRVLMVARRDGAATKRALRPMMAEPELEAALKSAVAKGLLRRLGSRGGTRYELAPSLVVGASGLEGRQRAQLLDEVRDRGAVTSTDAAHLLQTSTDAARRLLNDLASAGLLRAEGNTRGRKYRLP